jgi:hypothetical protein
MECQVEKNEYFQYLLLYEFSRGSKAAEPPEIFVPSTDTTLLLKEYPKNGLRASSKAILT